MVVESIELRLIARLKSPAKIELQKKTKEGEKRSEIVKTANTKVPVINPNWIALVRWAKKWWSRFRSLVISDAIAFPANQSDVQKNWETTIIGKINLMKRLIWFYAQLVLAANKPTIYLWSRQESNLDLKFRKLLFYPLNYGTLTL